MITVEIFKTEESANERNAELKARFEGQWDVYASVIPMGKKYGLPVMVDGIYAVDDSKNTVEIEHEEYTRKLDSVQIKYEDLMSAPDSDG